MGEPEEVWVERIALLTAFHDRHTNVVKAILVATLGD
jgi:hypothetical protein